MSVTLAGGNVVVNPPENPVSAVITQVNGTTGNTLYTVPTGRTFYCTQASVQYRASGSSTLFIRVGTTNKLLYECTVEGAGAQWSGQVLFTATEGEVINGYRDGGGSTLLDCGIQISGFIL